MRNLGGRLAYQRGQTDCARCSLATLLGLSYRSVPDFFKRYRKGHTQLAAIEKWLNKRGFEMVFMSPHRKPDCLYLACGPAARGFSHMVVMRKGKLAHDPHASGAGLRKVVRCWLVVPKDVGRR